MKLLDTVITFNASNRAEAARMNAQVCESIIEAGLATRAEFTRNLGENQSAGGYAVRTLFLAEDTDALYQHLEDSEDITTYEDVADPFPATEAALEARVVDCLDDLDLDLIDSYEDIDGAGDDDDDSAAGEGLEEEEV